MTTHRLDRVLVERGLVATRTKAKRLIDKGAVVVNGEVSTKTSQLVPEDWQIELLESDLDVGRGATKLRAALTHWPLPISGKNCVDLGASTGGFTQVLLEHGAASVVSIDVGHDQLDPRLQADSKVISREGVSVLDIDSQWWSDEKLPTPVSVIVADLSFISLARVAEGVVNTFGVHSHYLLLVKPQFEVGRTQVSRGIVKDAAKRELAVSNVAASVKAAGAIPRGVMVSPITGEKGNVEYILYASASPSIHPAEWDGQISPATEGE